MSDPVWPAGLPQSPLVEGYSEREGATSIAWRPEVGPPMSRQRWSGGLHEMTLAFMMTSAQLGTFETFYRTTLAGGSLPFEFVHFRKGTIRLLFDPSSAPSKDPVAGDLKYRVTLKVWNIP